MHRDEYGPGKHGEGLPETLSMRQHARTARHLANLVGLIGKGYNTSHPAVAQLRTALLRDAELCPTVEAACRLAAHTSVLSNLEGAHKEVLEAAHTARTHQREAQQDKWHDWLVEHRSRGPALSTAGSGTGPAVP